MVVRITLIVMAGAGHGPFFWGIFGTGSFRAGIPLSRRSGQPSRNEEENTRQVTTRVNTR